ncbi:MAG TPA: hypothetical protein VF396_05265, partial [Bradyrhizobium sp.]
LTGAITPTTPTTTTTTAIGPITQTSPNNATTVIISPEKTPGSAGGLTEFDSSGNMFLKLALAVQIRMPSS